MRPAPQPLLAGDRPSYSSPPTLALLLLKSRARPFLRERVGFSLRLRVSLGLRLGGFAPRPRLFLGARDELERARLVPRRRATPPAMSTRAQLARSKRRPRASSFLAARSASAVSLASLPYVSTIAYASSSRHFTKSASETTRVLEGLRREARRRRRAASRRAEPPSTRPAARAGVECHGELRGSNARVRASRRASFDAERRAPRREFPLADAAARRRLLHRSRFRRVRPTRRARRIADFLVGAHARARRRCAARALPVLHRGRRRFEGGVQQPRVFACGTSVRFRKRSRVL